MLNGANDGARTRDNQNHNLGMQVIFYKALTSFSGIILQIAPLYYMASRSAVPEKKSINNRVVPLIPHANLRPSTIYADVISGFRFATL